MARRGHTNVDQFQDEAPGLQNSFIEGLKTEFTGLNFPPNAATDTDNCVFTMLGDVTRRKGFDYELNYRLASLGDATQAIQTYIWKNAGGDGESILFVAQVGTNLYFYVVTDTTNFSPLSNHKLSSVVDLTTYLVSGAAGDIECQFADGNGYLFVYNNACDPVYCTYDPIGKTVTSNRITIKARDFLGVTSEAVNDPTTRLQTMSNDHEYNLRNQGWTRAPLWSVNVTDNLFEYFKMGDGSETIPKSFTGNGVIGLGVFIGDHPFTFPTGEPISPGTPVDINYSIPCQIYDIQAVGWTTGNATGTANGVVKTYDTNTGATVISVTFTDPVLGASNLEFGANPGGGGILGPVQYAIVSSKSINTIDTFFNQIGLYPSNADIWWIFKNEKDEFSPATTIADKGLPTAWAPKGHFILNAFNQDRTTATNEANSFASPVTGLQSISTTKRPTNGTWFQGRVWYAGVDDSQQAAGDQDFYTWTENIYFSRIVESHADFGKCHEDNDPTDQYSFNLLPSDGGVITIQGAGAIFKLLPIQNGMLVFAANGVWFITGSQGIGFSAIDYTITRISGVRSISSNSYVDVNGLPIFWNEEGIYAVAPAQQGLGLQVTPLTVKTIKSFYDQIPLSSKKAARGSYNPIDYVAQWIYGETTSSEGYALYLFDNSCHLFTSLDKGKTWVESETPPETMSDDWTDLQMAINDGDYTTMAAFDSNYKSSPFGFDSRIGISNVAGITGSWAIRNPAVLQANGTNSTDFISGAMTADAQIILALPVLIESPLTTFIPRISRDKGVTWSDVVVDNGNVGWFRAAFSQNGQIMYMMSKDQGVNTHPVYKSVDAGVTWSNLTSSPRMPTTGGDEGMVRLRCSQDGSTVAYIGLEGKVYTSIDGGTTWTTTTQATVDFVVNTADLSMSLDGSTILVGFTQSTSNLGFQDLAFVSYDNGLTWTDITTRLPNHSSLFSPDTLAVAVSPDGLVMLYAHQGLGDSLPSNTAASFDGGNTWSDVSFALNSGSGGGVGVWTAAYVVPQNVSGSPGFNRVLNYNTSTGAFYPWTISTLPISGVTTPRVHAVDYVQGPGGTNDPPAIFKYFTSVLNANGTYSYTFSEATDPTYVDWDYATETTGDVYSSYFTTGYTLYGQGLRKFQPMYLEMFTRLNESNMKYSIQGLWDFATSGNSGKWSTRQVISVDKPNFGMAFKRHKVRGNGHAFQLKVSSVSNSPFDIMGWNMQITQNAGM